jgi:transglutaminase-like putative cysteine protease
MIAMFIRIGFDIAYSFPQPTEMIMMLYTHPSRTSFLMTPERLTSDPTMVIEDFIDVYGNKCARAFCRGGRLNLRTDAIMVDSGLPDIQTPDTQQHTIHELPPDMLLYLLGSRYCEIEKLSDIAWNLFGHGPTGWGRLQAICDWVHNHITFAHESARCDRTAYDTFLDQRGVCRDLPPSRHTFSGVWGFPLVTQPVISEISKCQSCPPWISAPGSRSFSAANGTRSTHATTRPQWEGF